MLHSYYTQDELIKIGFQNLGKRCIISRKTSIYSPKQISIGNNVRIDDFCILSGSISIGSYVHISAFSALYAKFGIEIEDFVTISGKVLIYSQNDDYSGLFMTNPMVPQEFTNVTGGKVIFKKHSIVGAGSVVLPSVTFQEGSCAAAMSLVKTDLKAWKIYGGVPAKFIKKRKSDIIKLEIELLSKIISLNNP